MALIIEYQDFGYTFNESKPPGEDSIFVRVKDESSWNSSAYSKKVHKGSKDEDLDWNQIWYNKKGSSTYSTKNVKLTKTNKDDPLKSFETYFPSEPKTGKILVLGFVTKGGVKTYVTRTELKLEDESQLEFSVKPEGKNEFLAKLYEENFTQNKALTIKIDAISSYYNVDVKKGDPVRGTEEFHRYIHKPNTDNGRIEHLVLDCGSKCQFKEFKGNVIKNNLEEIGICFNKADTNNRVPLFIEFKPKSGQFGTNGNKVLQLESITKEPKDNPSKWTKNYKFVTSLNGDVSDIIEEIYNNLKEEINEILAIDDNSTVIKAVSGSVGTISAIGTGVGGFFLYKNSALVLSFLRSLF